MSDDYDLNLGNGTFGQDSVIQFATDRNSLDGSYQRNIASVPSRYLSIFFSPYIFPKGDWVYYECMLCGDGSNMARGFLMGKLPPPTFDSVVRNTFETMVVTIPARAGADGAYVQFGYAENGPVGNFYCVSRQETCVASRSKFTVAVPFQFKIVESPASGNPTPWNPVECSEGCSINVPTLPNRHMYYQVVYTASGTQVATLPMQVASIP